MASKVDNKRGATRRTPGGSRRAPNRRVYIGFWTDPQNKVELQKIAERNKMSVSSSIDWIVEQFIIKTSFKRYKAERDFH